MAGERLTRKQAIREKCIDCSGGNKAEVRRCPATKCALWPYRMGAEVTTAAGAETREKQGAEIGGMD